MDKNVRTFKASKRFDEAFEDCMRRENSIRDELKRKHISKSDMLENMATYYWNHVYDTEAIKKAEQKEKRYIGGIINDVMIQYQRATDRNFNILLIELQRCVMFLRLLVSDEEILSNLRGKDMTQLISNMISDEEIYRRVSVAFESRADEIPRYFFEPEIVKAEVNLDKIDEKNKETNKTKDDNGLPVFGDDEEIIL